MTFEQKSVVGGGLAILAAGAMAFGAMAPASAEIDEKKFRMDLKKP